METVWIMEIADDKISVSTKGAGQISLVTELDAVAGRVSVAMLLSAKQARKLAEILNAAAIRARGEKE